MRGDDGWIDGEAGAGDFDECGVEGIHAGAGHAADYEASFGSVFIMRYIYHNISIYASC